MINLLITVNIAAFPSASAISWRSHINPLLCQFKKSRNGKSISYHPNDSTEFLSHCFFINSKSTLSHGVRNFYFNLSRARARQLTLSTLKMHKCRAVRPNLIGITCTESLERETFDIERDSFVCRLMLAIYRRCQSSELFASKPLWAISIAFCVSSRSEGKLQFH
jgi:hypothetical protein